VVVDNYAPNPFGSGLSHIGRTDETYIYNIDKVDTVQNAGSLIINTAIGVQYTTKHNFYVATEISTTMAINTSAVIQNSLKGLSASAAFKVGYSFGKDALFVPYVGVGYTMLMNMQNMNSVMHGVSPILGFIFKPAGQNIISMFIEASVPMYFNSYSTTTNSYFASPVTNISIRDTQQYVNTVTNTNQLIIMPQITAGLQINF
jgi:hypothetical protein